MSQYLSIPIMSNGNPLSTKNATMVPVSRAPVVNAVLNLGPFENQNVTRVWEALKNSSYTIDNAMTYGQIEPKEYQLEELLKQYRSFTHAAIGSLSRHLRKVGTHILVFADQNDERRYTIIMDDETIEFAIEIHRKRIRTEQTDNKMLQEMPS
jgi:hypothetical protein